MEKLNIQTECLELDEQLEFYKNQLTDKIFEQDHLLLHECEDIENSYFKEFGELEFKIKDYTLKNKKYEMEISKIKQINPRRGFNIKFIENEVDEYFKKEDDEIRYLRAKINILKRKNKSKEEYEYDFPLFKQLKKELIEYEKSINEYIEDEEEIPENELNLEEKEELNEIYKYFIYSIHPYFHENLNEEEYDLFFTAKDYFKNNDLSNIRFLKKDNENKLMSKKEINLSDDELNRQINRLKNKIKLVNDDITEIKNKKPYILKSIIDNPENISSYKKELENKLKEAQNNYDILKSKKISAIPTRDILNSNFQ